MDFKLLRAFVAVAETENIGLAAERLHISQSPLSRQILLLESRLGLTLFERSRQRLRLTDEGRLFLIEARDLLSQTQRLEAQARRLARGESGSLAVGYVEAAMHSGRLPEALRLFKLRHPKVDITLHPMPSAAQGEDLNRRRIDLGLVYSPPDDPCVEVLKIHDETLVLAMPPDHGLADRSDIRAGDLQGLPWIALPERRNPQARQRFLDHCRSFGFTPDIQMEAEDLIAVLRLVGAGLGATFVQASLREAFPKRVAFRAIANFPSSVKTYAIWRTGDPKPLVTAFRQVLASTSAG